MTRFSFSRMKCRNELEPLTKVSQQVAWQSRGVPREQVKTAFDSQLAFNLHVISCEAKGEQASNLLEACGTGRTRGV